MHLAPRGAAALLRVVRAAPPVHSSLGLARCPALLPREALRPWRPLAAAGAFRCLYARPRYAKPRSTGSTGSTGAADANAAEAAEAIDIQPPFAVRAGLVGAATALMTPLFPVIGFNQLVRLSAHWRTHAVRHSPTYTHTHSRTARARAHTHTHTHTHKATCTETPTYSITTHSRTLAQVFRFVDPETRLVLTGGMALAPDLPAGNQSVWMTTATRYAYMQTATHTHIHQAAVCSLTQP